MYRYGQLLSDTELAENPVEHIFVGDLADDRTERIGGGGDVDRDDLRRQPTQRAFAAGLQRAQRLRERIAMASARNRNLAFGARTRQRIYGARQLCAQPLKTI